MSASIIQLAASEPFSAQVRRATQGSGFSTRDLLLAILASSLLALLLFIWTYIRFRKKRQEAEARDFGRLTSQSTSTSCSDDEESPRRKRRRRRRAHRPRNPSLQQTGGLPPPRPEDQPPKY